MQTKPPEHGIHIVSANKPKELIPETYIGFATIKAQNLSEAAVLLNRFSNGEKKDVKVVEVLPMMNQLKQSPELEILVHVTEKETIIYESATEVNTSI